jgi:hypothetical protein
VTKFVAISAGSHTQKRWRRPTSFRFAANEPMASIVLAEIVHVGSSMPIAFIERAGRYAPMAMMSPMPGHNLFIGPEGQWLGGYVPASLRSYPFRLIRPEGSEKMTLCVDEDSGVIVDANGEGEAFFTSDGKPSHCISAIMELLSQIEGSRTATELATASLTEAGVIEPWPLEVDVGGKKTAINGLHRVNNSALAQLDDEAFLTLRKTSALLLAYAQLLSMGQIARFDQLVRLRQQLAQTPKIKAEDVLQFVPNDSIRFE